ncbi:Putative glycosyltransferase EpsF [Pirellula sp. SH-Sr6A]|uniref:glycosyltransferase family 4 protein n=1 Tax=Pirellula sp. SH-Sr6A TaxID=1632865 RepID=UPI00078D0ED2|nr:glycosyltransferase family 4 protein [Pirellula sp. SH-Sr6A]AMV34090.1 Putative glycosyltransferase EpsF [Pirellula sp. SH-Sr6A]
MRIFLLFAPGGVVQELCRAGHEVFACNSSTEFLDMTPFAPRFQSHWIQAHQKLSPTAIREIRQRLHQFQPDVIQSFTPFGLAWVNLAQGWSPFSSRQRAAVVSFRGITKRLSRFDPANWLTFYHPRVRWHACESFAVQDSMVQSRFSRSRCPVTYNTVSIGPPSQTSADTRAAWNIPTDRFLFGTIATIRPVKGIDILLRAIQQNRNENLHWVIMGSGKDETVERLLRDPQVQSRVTMLGHGHAASSHLHALDAFVMPSRSEGLCRSLIEAMLQGRPAVVSDAGGMKELVRHGIDGLVVPREEPDRLAEAMFDLAASPHVTAMGVSARDRAMQLCGAEKVTEKLLAIYREAIASQRSAT